MTVLRAAARRFLGLLALASAVTVAGAVFLGLLAGVELGRAISLGFYLVGSFLVVAGFFVGNRGPVRSKDDGGGASFVFPTRRRWASAEEHAATINDSAVFVALGFALIVIGVAADSRYSLF